MTLFAVRTTLARSTMVGRRQMSTTPKLHRAADKWPGFLKERPPKDHLDEHVSHYGRRSDMREKDCNYLARFFFEFSTNFDLTNVFLSSHLVTCSCFVPRFAALVW